MTIATTALAVTVSVLSVLPSNQPGNGAAPAPVGDDGHAPPQVDPRAKLVKQGDDPESFRPLVEWTNTFQGANQVPTYGDKAPVVTQHPLRLSGRPLYREGELGPGLNLIGANNLVFHHLLVYGDWRNAAGYSDNGGPGANDEVGRFATRLNLDVDFGITATERIHAFIRPLDRNADFTGFDFAGDNDGDEQLLVDGNLDALFFEGDLGAIFRGPGYPSMPIAFGKMPMFFQNGVWVEDVFTGVAVSVPAKNSPRFDIANYDWTVFAAIDDVTTGASDGNERDENDIFVVGAAAFVEANEGYWEAGYGYTGGSGSQSDIDYHNLTAAFTKRYGGWLSNSVRTIVNLGQDKDGPETADGILFLFENSLITGRLGRGKPGHNPYMQATVVPYFNAFLGIGTPQSLARDAGAGGVLKNTGINFEADAQTAFPSLDASGHDVIGAALGLEYLFDLDKQVVVEMAAQTDHGDENKSAGSEFGLGSRVQIPLNHAWILRFDAMVGFRDDGDEIAGVRVELRWKF
ncbi:MAG: hypothetical protein GC161_02830 [Planctomycetaceae bacterium]|nr:hypothetical protein [Planctomycetaceae bacterium]